MKTNFQASETRARYETVMSAIALIKDGYSQAEAAARLGVPAPTLSRWRRAWEKSGGDINALTPKSANAGRRPAFTLDGEEESILRHLRLQRGGLPLAIEEFARHPACRLETKEAIFAILDRAAQRCKAPAWPLSLRRAAHVTPEDEALFRGPKAFGNISISNRRGMFYRDADGRDHDLMTHSIWESDDYSCNAPYYIADPETGKVSLCRQMLATIDVYSAGWTGIDAVGRERDAYRAEDILRHMLRTIDSQGTMPRIWRLERGTWESKGIDGVELKDGTIWGGLDALFEVVHVFTSRGKGLVESSFNLVQNAVDHRSATIGRSRGEFEKAAKDHLKLNNKDRAKMTTVEEARKAGFWSAAECADEHSTQMKMLNERPRERGAIGGHHAPDDMRAARPGVARPLPADERWRFLPVKREATVRSGFVDVMVSPYPRSFRFQINGLGDLHLEHGFRVLIAFDPAEPSAGCHVFNGERGSKNREGWHFGQKLLVAEMEGDIPQVDLSGSGDFEKRKKASAVARTEFRGIVPAGRKGYRVSQSQDGRGNVARIEQNKPAAAIEATPEAPPARRAKAETNEFPERSEAAPKTTPRMESWLELLNE